ncbi:hypothetical protein THRCLA_21238 [Thraustotheca clavata]|uniref:Uncharacterized protein n=1 Tax=Thraustotheca clavata TaxID=74557 RepID=A0A1V9ZYI3_9STRA|nr:hypothetical protein THRCLA_21238 [Thraustotheca clavata]
MEDELAQLKILRESSRELVEYLESVRTQFDVIQEENEKALQIMENWAAVFAITKGIAKIQNENASGGFTSIPL